jgi:hypothetical protein
MRLRGIHKPKTSLNSLVFAGRVPAVPLGDRKGTPLLYTSMVRPIRKEHSKDVAYCLPYLGRVLSVSGCKSDFIRQQIYLVERQVIGMYGKFLSYHTLLLRSEDCYTHLV